MYGSSTHVEQEKGCPYQALATPQLSLCSIHSFCKECREKIVWKACSCKLCGKPPRKHSKCHVRGSWKAGRPCGESLKRLLPGSLHLKSASLAGWNPGFERVACQAIQWHHNKPRKTCRTPAIPWPPTFTSAVCVLCLQPRISWSTCPTGPTVSPLTYLFYFAWHFLLKTSLYLRFPIFQTLSNKIPYNSSNFPQKLHKAAKADPGEAAAMIQGH